MIWVFLGIVACKKIDNVSVWKYFFSHRFADYSLIDNHALICESVAKKAFNRGKPAEVTG
jgi:hypothetical protein